MLDRRSSIFTVKQSRQSLCRNNLKHLEEMNNLMYFSHDNFFDKKNLF